MNYKIVAIVVVVAVVGYLMVFRAGAPYAKLIHHSTSVSNVTHTGGTTGGESENDGGAG